MKLVASALVLFCVAGSVSADGVQFLASDGSRLYRGDLNGNVDPFVTLSAPIQSLTRVPEGYSVAGATGGDIIATAVDPVGGAWKVYRLDDPFGAATLTQIGSTTFGVGSMAFSPGGLFAVNDSSSPIKVSRLDTATFGIAQTYSTGVAVSGSGGLAYAPGGSSFFLTDYTNNRLLSWVPGNNATVIGSTGIGFTNNGLEYLNGVLYGAIRPDSPSTQLRVGTFDTSTGLFTPKTTITGINGSGTGFVTIPAPGSGFLLGIAGVACARRRR